ncbi:MAG: GatB/YqeY domain-containing protein [Candidatus Paceibacterota bacterium]
MTLHKQIKDQIKEAMIKKDAFRLMVLRGLSAAFMNEIVAKKIIADELGDEDTITIIRRLVKQRKDSIEQFTKGGRADLAENEEAEMKILETFLPQLMSKEEVEVFVKGKIAETGEIDKTKLGQFMGTIMKDLKGKADGMIVKEIIELLVK